MNDVVTSGDVGSSTSFGPISVDWSRTEGIVVLRQSSGMEDDPILGDLLIEESLVIEVGSLHLLIERLERIAKAASQ